MRPIDIRRAPVAIVAIALLVAPVAAGASAASLGPAAARPASASAASYGVLDLLAHWDVGAGVAVDAGIFNLTDRVWWDWADVPGVASDSPVVDRYTRPGRSVSVSVAVAW